MNSQASGPFFVGIVNFGYYRFHSLFNIKFVTRVTNYWGLSSDLRALYYQKRLNIRQPMQYLYYD